MEKHQLNQNICWDCKNAVGGCSWSRNLTPVDGWEAEQIPYMAWENKDFRKMETTYHITKCPKFIEDEPRHYYPESLSNEENKEFVKGKKFPKTSAGYAKRTGGGEK